MTTARDRIADELVAIKAIFDLPLSEETIEHIRDGKQKIVVLIVGSETMITVDCDHYLQEETSISSNIEDHTATTACIEISDSRHAGLVHVDFVNEQILGRSECLLDIVQLILDSDNITNNDSKNECIPDNEEEDDDDGEANSSKMSILQNEFDRSSASEACNGEFNSYQQITLARRGCYSHHIINSMKRQVIQQWALKLKINVICRFGWPGLLICEGEKYAVDTYLQALCSLNWKYFSVRFEEDIQFETDLNTTVDNDNEKEYEFEYQKYNEMKKKSKAFQNRDDSLEPLTCLQKFESHRKLKNVNIELSDMSETADLCRSLNVEDIFRCILKLKT